MGSMVKADSDRRELVRERRQARMGAALLKGPAGRAELTVNLLP